MPRYMLDTNILIYLIKRKPASAIARIDALEEDETLCMSFVSYAELLKGAERSTRTTKVLQALEQLIRQVPVCYEADAGMCGHYARHAIRLREAGTPIGTNDLWIACHALALDATLVTNNVRKFERVDGLRLENWVEGSD